jgi:glycerol-3-phosphate dehydrogenase
VVYSYQVEMARTLEDIFDRRLQLQYNHCSSHQCRQSIKDILNSYAAQS